MIVRITDTAQGLDLLFNSLTGQWSGPDGLSREMAAALVRDGLDVDFRHDTPATRAVRTVRGYGFLGAVAEIVEPAKPGEFSAGADHFKA